MSFCSMKDSILEKTNFSKILLKLDSKEIGLELFAFVLSSALKIGIIFAIFKFSGIHPSRNRKIYYFRECTAANI